MTALRAAGAPLALVAAIVVGIKAGEASGPSGSVPLLILAVVAGLGALVASGRLRLAISAIGVLLLACALTGRAFDGMVHSAFRAPAQSMHSVVLRGTLVGDPDPFRFSTSALVRVTNLDGAAVPARTVLVRASGDLMGQLGILGAGDRVRLDGMLEPLEGWDAYQRWRHAVARLELRRIEAFTATGAPLTRVADAIRGRVLEGTRGLPASERALLAGFLLGDTRSMSAGTKATFRDAGLSHLVAVSGENLAFVLALASPFLGRMPRTGRLVGGIAVIVVFGTMTRWEPSVLRAATMAVLALLARYSGRPASAARLLALGAGLLLLIDPFLVHSVGFELSCAACAGIAFLGPPVSARLRGPAWFREALGTTFAAQLGVAPVQIPIFGSLPLVALPANVLAAPLVGPITVLGLVSSVVADVFGARSTPGRIVALPVFVLVRLLEGVATASARFPLAVDGRGVLLVGAVVSLIAAGLRLRGRSAPAAVP
ncbi:MAG: ComEC/Rec2-related protein [Actinomycetia bacterium]|nr:ComEC/Rec2-related protein [Actinomycetes bacterium]